MNEVKSVLRTENKYLLKQEQYFHLKQYFQKVLYPDPNNGASGYMVRSLYFDTLDDRDFYDKQDGIEDRRKLRLRIYDPNAPTAKLELKEKSGVYQRKRSLIIKREHALAMMNGNFSSLTDVDHPFANELWCLTSCHVYRPKCIVEYQRVAFMHPVNHTRVTFDFNVRSGLIGNRFFDEHAAPCPILLPNNILMEVKYNGFLLSYIKDAVSAGDRNQVAFSKYCMGRGAGV